MCVIFVQSFPSPGDWKRRNALSDGEVEKGFVSQSPVVLCQVGMKSGTHWGLCGPSVKKVCFAEVLKKEKTGAVNI